MGDLEISDGMVWGGGGKAVRRGSGHWHGHGGGAVGVE